MSKMLRNIPNWNVKSSEKDKPRAGDKRKAQKEIQESLASDLTQTDEGDKVLT